MNFYLPLAFGLIICTMGCKGDAPAASSVPGTVLWSKVDVKPIDASLRTIEFGVAPWVTERDTELIIRPLLRHLEEETGYRFILNVSLDYDELVDDFIAGHIQIADLSATLYVRLLRAAPDSSRYLATISRLVDDKKIGHYQGFIITHRDHPAMSLQDLKGESFAFVDKGSSSGFKYPLARLLEHGVEPQRDFSETFFVGNHEAVAEAVAQKQVAAGAIWDQTLWDAQSKYGDVFKILAKTRRIPREAWVASKNLPQPLIQKIGNTLTQLEHTTLDQAGQRLFLPDAPFTSFVLESKEFYQFVEETSRVVDRYMEKYPTQ